MTKLEINVDNVLMFDEFGAVEYSLFIGNSDEPVYKEVMTLEKMALDFLEMRSVNGNLCDYHVEEAQKLCDALEDSLALIKAALK